MEKNNCLKILIRQSISCDIYVGPNENNDIILYSDCYGEYIDRKLMMYVIFKVFYSLDFEPVILDSRTEIDKYCVINRMPTEEEGNIIKNKIKEFIKFYDNFFKK